jgi:hypothetical protein
MKRWSVWALAAVLGSGLCTLVAVSIAGAARQGGAPVLTVTSPVDNAEVREKVKITVPRDAVPDEGFIAIYIDNQFKVAVAPPPVDEEPGQAVPAKPVAPKPIEYLWDTKERSTDMSLPPDRQFTQDGPHILEIRSYDKNGSQVGQKRLTVHLTNRIPFAQDEPVRLIYGGRVGNSWYDNHTIDMIAQAGDRGFSQTSRNNPYTRLTHKETDKYLLSIEDLQPVSSEAYVRERREPIIEIITNSTKNFVRLDSSSVYYTMSAKGVVEPSSAMKRTKREPFANIIELPGRTYRMNEGPFPTTVRINLGTYIPTVLTIDKAQATLEGMEWEGGRKAVKIKVTYNSGDYKLSVLDQNIHDADFTLNEGTSLIYFAPELGRVVRAEHEILGVLKAPIAGMSGNVGGNVGGFGEPGPEGGPFGSGGSPFGSGGGTGGIPGPLGAGAGAGAGGPGGLGAPPGFGSGGGAPGFGPGRGRGGAGMPGSGGPGSGGGRGRSGGRRGSGTVGTGGGGSPFGSGGGFSGGGGPPGPAGFGPRGVGTGAGAAVGSGMEGSFGGPFGGGSFGGPAGGAPTGEPALTDFHVTLRVFTRAS